MASIGRTGQRWLKIAHIIFAGLWLGGGALISLRLLFVDASSGGELYGILSSMVFVDYAIIIPGAVGTLLTSLIYGIWTRWGFFKHRWVTVKWAIVIFGNAFGTIALHPWIEEMTEIAKRLGMGALSDPTYLHNRQMVMIFGTFQLCTILFAIILSTLKPWKRREATQAA